MAVCKRCWQTVLYLQCDVFLSENDVQWENNLYLGHESSLYGWGFKIRVLDDVIPKSKVILGVHVVIIFWWHATKTFFPPWNNLHKWNMQEQEWVKRSILIFVLKMKELKRLKGGKTNKKWDLPQLPMLSMKACRQIFKRKTRDIFVIF